VGQIYLPNRNRRLGKVSSRSGGVAKLGTLPINGVVPDNEAEHRHIIFDPIPRLDGIAPSGDPLLVPRADLYLMSGRRRRFAAAKVAS
jgi:catalase